MLDFIKNVFATAVGLILTFLFFFFVIFILIVSTSGDPEPFVRDNSVLSIKVSGLVPENTAIDPFEPFFNTVSPSSVSLRDLEDNLKKAAVDEKIQGVLMEIDFVGTPWPVLEQMHRAITRFREESGKFVYATTNDMGINEQGYFLATAADSIFAPDFTMMQFDGFVIEGTFLKGMLDKIGVEAEVYHRGRYKSAGDGLIRESFSDADREQIEAVFSAMVETFETTVANRNGMSRQQVQEILNAPPRLDISYYAELGFIDEIITRDELESRIKARIAPDSDRSLSLVPNRRYSKVTERTAGLGRPASESIALIYASGAIMPATGDSDFPFGGETLITVSNFQESLDQALEDDNVKAIVVRVNSPGGAASTSDVIWSMIKEARDKKPVIVSMGSVAASGGYYIAMAADQIVAESTTITGSIGVIGMMLNANELMTDKLGMSFDEIRFHDNANWLNPTQPMNAEQRQAFRTFIDNSYDGFVQRVADSRNMSFEAVHAVAQGRIWNGNDALEAGLIDKVGGLDDAILLAAEMVELENYSLKVLPREKTFFEQLSAQSGASVRSFFSSEIPYYNEMSTVRHLLIQNKAEAWAVMPYMLEVK